MAVSKRYVDRTVRCISSSHLMSKSIRLNRPHCNFVCFVRVWNFSQSLWKGHALLVHSSWHVMAHGDAREGKWSRKLANGAGRQYSSHYLGLWCIQHYYRWCAHLGCQYWTELTPSTDLNELVRFAGRRNLVSARVPSYFKRSLAVGEWCFEECIWNWEGESKSKLQNITCWVALRICIRP